MTRPKLYLHVGTHKTGTTSIQHTMRDNLQLLQQAGICYLWRPRTARRAPIQPRHIGNLFIRPDLVTPYRIETNSVGALKGWRRAMAIGSLLRKLRRSGCDTWIISSEALCFCRTDAEADRLRRAFHGCDVTIVIGFREDVSWRESWAGELAANPQAVAWRFAHPDKEWVDDEWYFDKQAIRNFWNNVGEVQEIDFDRERAERGSVVPAFLDIIGAAHLNIDTQVFKNVRNPERVKIRQTDAELGLK